MGVGHVLTQPNKSRSSSGNNTTRQEELRLVRLKQQEIANERAKQAAIERKQKEAEEKDRKNHIAKKKAQGGGDKLGKGTNSS